eukprot:GHVS01042874.1.p1 GENE.GHVS01042874.1~~GHVS01042874.1.p1  ORF type:complete len:264 (-),score=85.39 GHVS01042874.1:448-1239(-)
MLWLMAAVMVFYLLLSMALLPLTSSSSSSLLFFVLPNRMQQLTPSSPPPFPEFSSSSFSFSHRLVPNGSSSSFPPSLLPPPPYLLSPSTTTTSSRGLSVLFHIRRHMFRKKKWRRLVYGIGTSNESVPALQPPPLDSVFLGKYRVIWTVEDFTQKLRWRYREMLTPPLKTSRFPLAHYRGLQLKLWPDGHKSTKEGYMAVSLHQQEHWEQIEDSICLSVGGIKRGPFKHLSPEYSAAAQSFCRLDELNIVDNKLQVAVEIAAV